MRYGTASHPIWSLYSINIGRVKRRFFAVVEVPTAQAAEQAGWIEGKTAHFRGAAMNGLKALQMVHAVYESARLHEKVSLPMQTRYNPLDLMVESGHLAPQRPGQYDIRAYLLRGERMASDAEGVS